MFPKTSGIPKLFILKRVFYIVKHPFWDTPIFGNIHVYDIYIYDVYEVISILLELHDFILCLKSEEEVWVTSW